MRYRKKLATRTLELALVVLAILIVSEYVSLQDSAHAAVDIVTVPARDSVQLTIYNSADITLAKDRRNLTFKKGSNQIQFSWANTLIDPTSVEFRALKNADKIEIVDTTYPANRPDTLIWNIKSQVDGPVPVEITYFTSGLTWQADYVAIAAPDESKIDLSGLVKIVNNSGEDYENAQVRLVVGTIHLVENIADLARRGYRGMDPGRRSRMRDEYRKDLEKAENALRAPRAPSAEPMARAKKIVKEGLSEYFIYTIEGTETVPNRWAKRMPSLDVTAIPVKAIYRYAEHKYGRQAVRFYKFKNRKVEGKKPGENNLGGEPLPDGVVRVFKRDKDGSLSFVGQQAIKYMPIGEDVEVNLGADPEVILERKLLDYKKLRIQWDTRGRHSWVTGWDTEERYHTRIKNTKGIAIQFEIERVFGGDWDLDTELKFDKLNQQTVRFVLQFAPGEQKEFSYKLTTRHGKNSKR